MPYTSKEGEDPLISGCWSKTSSGPIPTRVMSDQARARIWVLQPILIPVVVEIVVVEIAPISYVSTVPGFLQALC